MQSQACAENGGADGAADGTKVLWASVLRDVNVPSAPSSAGLARPEGSAKQKGLFHQSARRQRHLASGSKRHPRCSPSPIGSCRAEETLSWMQNNCAAKKPVARTRRCGSEGSASPNSDRDQCARTPGTPATPSSTTRPGRAR